MRRPSLASERAVDISIVIPPHLALIAARALSSRAPISTILFVTALLASKRQSFDAVSPGERISLILACGRQVA